MKLFKKYFCNTDEIESSYYSTRYLQSHSSFDDKIDFIPLLTQAGYLTIIDYNEERDSFKLDFPNFENEEALNLLILDFYTHKISRDTLNVIYDLKDALLSLNFEKFFAIFENLVSSISYMNREKNEKYYSSIFHIVLKLLELSTHSEVQTHTGRIDTIVEIKNQIFIFEYKFNKTAQDALNQIEEKRYYAPYLDNKKQIILIGISFNYIERKRGIKKGPTFDIECKTEQIKH